MREAETRTETNRQEQTDRETYRRTYKKIVIQYCQSNGKRPIKSIPTLKNAGDNFRHVSFHRGDAVAADMESKAKGRNRSQSESQRHSQSKHLPKKG